MPRSDRTWTLLLVGVTAVFLAVIGYPRQWSQGLLINDEFWYAHLARSLHQGAGYVSNVMYPLQAPHFSGFPVPEAMKQSGFQLVTAAVWLLTGESMRAMLLVAALGLVGFAAGSFLLARHLGWGRGVSLFVAGATIAHPVVAQYGIQALPESLYFACFVFTVLLVLRGGARDLVAAGALNAVLLIIKGHGLIYLPLFAAFLWVRSPGDGADGSWRAGVADALRPAAAKVRAVGAYLGVALATLIIAHLVLPSGSVHLFQQGGTYSHGILIEVDRATADIPYLYVDPPPAWEYVFAHPDQYLGKVARMVKRTKQMIEVAAGPALGGILFPALLLAGGLLLADLLLPGRLLPPARDPGEGRPYLLFIACIVWTLMFFWPIFLSARFLVHLLPLMLLVCLYVGARLAALAREPNPRLRAALAAAAVVWFVAFPVAATVWDSYREPRKLLGSMLAVRYLDYDRMAANVEAHLDDDAVVVSDMAHEIAWLTGRRAIAFPAREQDLRYMIDKFDVDAVYEHPRLRRDWTAIDEGFTLVDADDGYLWVRRRAGN